MDPHGDRLLAAARSTQNLERAFKLLLRERTKSESFCDWGEIEASHADRTRLILAAQQAIDQGRMPDGISFLYRHPKNKLVDRRLIYRPFLDCLIKFALVMPLADHVEPMMSERSFANRRATGSDADVWLLAPYAKTAVPAWRTWKEEETDRFNVVLATDLSSFYDSVSHEGLIHSLCQAVGAHPTGAWANLMRASLNCNVQWIDDMARGTTQTLPLRQGLSTGCAADAILANVFLIETDVVLQRNAALSAGRYADDILVFGTDRLEVERTLRDLTHQLASRAINLNVKKTRIEISEDGKRKLVGEHEHPASDVPSGDFDYDVDHESEPPGGSFPDFERVFPLPLDFAAIEASPADFCKFMSQQDSKGNRLLPLERRLPEHLTALALILREHPDRFRHATWLVVETMTHPRVAENARKRARDLFQVLLDDPHVAPLAKARLLHHVARPRDLNSKVAERWMNSKLTDDERLGISRSLIALQDFPDLALRRAVRHAMQHILTREAPGSVSLPDARSPSASIP